jgi:hypothetical protein
MSEFVHVALLRAVSVRDDCAASSMQKRRADRRIVLRGGKQLPHD